MPIRLLPAAFVLVNLVDDPRIYLEANFRCLLVEVKRTGQSGILQASERCIDALLNRIALNSRLGIAQISSRELFDLGTDGSCRFNKNT